MANHRTITLSDAPPVRIQEERWPIIAEAGHPPEVGWLKVRRHDDRRSVVYGGGDPSPQARGGTRLRAGYVVAAADYPAGVVSAVRRVAEEIGCPGLAHRVISDLPAELL